ncbi:MAG: pyridoxamine 5'-phosphate oxidase family protein [Sphingomonas sp.]|uniref:pyridoxamine 5'-phosphate oxidase family protein n=1 Tax=Sphingomonas sp. TaxID=28214 RepID=UPI0025E83421|nr:pyridoxamine 5'-phosphate oxidase family protein [Sphingomonas sp.]MBY0283363.1 pyridoxamine 5'-phosphate oxidase family protein [Sphingomonas sp.]
MAEMTLADLSEKMRDIDFAMLSTRTDNGAIAARPMSNNRDVDYGGDSYFFSYDSALTISDIAADPQVGLTLTGGKGLLGKPPLFIGIAGRAELIRDKAVFARHWQEGFERWFEQGIDTPGLILIKVHAARVHYWDGEDGGEVKV